MGCNNSTQAGGAEDRSRLLPSFATGNNIQDPPALSLRLAWVQEKNFEDKFEVVRIIGQGSIGEVSIVRRKPVVGSQHDSNKSPSLQEGSGAYESSSENIPALATGSGGDPSVDRVYAMKSIHVNRLSKSRVAEFENEVQILQQLHHPNIIQLREVYYHKKMIYMLMTLCTGGQLNEVELDESQVCSVMSQVVRALVYMHETAMISHRDLKMENIMLESPGEPLVVKLIDFGLSKMFTEGDKMRTACGTVYTMAPEVLSGAGYTQKADLWSAGVIAFALLSDTLPFLKDETDLKDKDKVERLEHARYAFSSPKWKTVSGPGKAFVRGLLKKQPGFRWTAREALNHCADVWGPALLRQSYADLHSQVETAKAATVANGAEPRHDGSVGSPRGKPPSDPNSPSSPTHASRHRTRTVPGSIATSMRRFADYGEFKKAALMVTAFQLGREEIKQLKDAFLEVDTMGNGAISLEELEMVLREHGVDQAEVDRVFGAVDMDRSGRLHYMEFLAATVEAKGYIQEELLKEAFERMDVDSTGFISRENLVTVLGTTYDSALIDKMLREVGVSLSGSIEWEDFLAMMRPVVVQEYRKDAEDILAHTSAAIREVTEVERRAVDQTPSFADIMEIEGRLSAARESEDGR